MRIVYLMCMEVLFELLYEIVLSVYAEFAESVMPQRKIGRVTRSVLSVLSVLVSVAAVTLVVAGIVFIYESETPADTKIGIIILSVGGGVIALHIALIVETYIKNSRTKKRLRARYSGVLGRRVHVTVDRPLGSRHPDNDNIVYGLNYGFVAGVTGGDGEEQDAYIAGVTQPVTEFDGIVTAVIHRHDDNECKWIVVPQGKRFTDDELIESTAFQEKYFSSVLVR